MEIFNHSNEDVSALRAAIRKQGFAVLETRVSELACSHFMAFIDQYENNKSEINYAGTEKRIWDSQLLDPAVKAFGAMSDQIMGIVFNRTPKLKTVLSYSNFPIPHQEQLITGRWHLDSVRNQYKLFCFLTKTEERTGPLELLPGSHLTAFKLWPLFTGQYISLTDLGTGKRCYQQLDEHWVDAQCRKVGGSVPLLCEAGTLILVDTSAIHRARPCLEGKRYALCTYYGHF